MLRDCLNLINLVTVRRIVETTTSVGSTIKSTTDTVLTRCTIWMNNSNNPFVSDKITKDSSHVLALETGEYTFNDSDSKVLYGTKVFNIVGHDDDVSFHNEVTIVNLDRLT